MKHYGDITKISGYEVETVDVITGGSPCQDLSVAGKRAGLAGERSGLFMEQIRIIKEMRDKEKQSGKADDDIRPRYMVWENVPGAFSSNKGEDFRAVLEETAKVKDPTVTIPGFKKWQSAGCIMGNGYSIAWRVHDAQYWGVPQRRKRISLVADFNGNTAPEVLFKSDCLSRDIETCSTEKQDTSDNVEGRPGKAISFQERGGCPGGGKGILIQNERLASIRTNQNQYVCMGLARERCGANAYTEGVSTTLPASMGMGGGYVPMLAYEEHSQGFPLGFRAENTKLYDEKSTTLCNGTRPGYTQGVITTSHGGFMINADDSDVAHTLQATDYKDPQVVCHNATTICLEGNGKRESHKGNGYRESDTMYTLNTVEKHGVCYSLDRASFNQGKNAQYTFTIEEDKSQTLVSKGPGAICARDYKGVGNQYVSEDKCVVESYQQTVGSLCARDYKGVAIVRRTTPLECERLQGYPDNWTNIGDWIDSKGKKHKGEADAPRYKALGNSIALPFWQYLAENICEHDVKTMASLFDGISGFCLVFARVGCKPIWSSEIEEFPIAVAKKHFGDDEKGEKGDYEKYL